jgi:hypothetical protein
MSDDLSIPNSGYRGNQAGRYGTGQARARPGMDPDTRRLVMFAGGLGAVLVALIGASALVGRHGGEVPVVTADARPVREKPLHPGGMKIDGVENDVFSGQSDNTNARLSAAPEAPDTNGLRAAAVPAQPAVETPAQTAAARPSPPASPAPLGKPAVVASMAPVAKPAPAKPAPTPGKPAPAAVVESHPGGHPATVQLAALSSEEAARNEWKQLSKRAPELLNGRQPSFQRVERDGHTVWRVRTSGFADVAQARIFCDHARTKGLGCSVAEF